MSPDQNTTHAKPRAERAETRERRNASTQTAPESFGVAPPGAGTPTSGRWPPSPCRRPRWRARSRFSKPTGISPCARGWWTTCSSRDPSPSHPRTRPQEFRLPQGPDRGSAVLAAARGQAATGAVAWSQSPPASAVAGGASSAARACRRAGKSCSRSRSRTVSARHAAVSRSDRPWSVKKQPVVPAAAADWPGRAGGRGQARHSTSAAVTPAVMVPSGKASGRSAWAAASVRWNASSSGGTRAFRRAGTFLVQAAGTGGDQAVQDQRVAARAGVLGCGQCAAATSGSAGFGQPYRPGQVLDVQDGARRDRLHNGHGARSGGSADVGRRNRSRTGSPPAGTTSGKAGGRSRTPQPRGERLDGTGSSGRHRCRRGGSSPAPRPAMGRRA